MPDILIDLCSSSTEFYARLTAIFIDAWIASTKILLEPKNWQNLQELENKWLSGCRKIFESGLKEEQFVNSLSNALDCYSKLAQTTGIGQWYQNVSNLSSFWNNYFIEPLRDFLWRTPSQKIHSEGNFALFHYDNIVEKLQDRAPVLVVYAFINRHYILDLLPEVSIIRSLLSTGLDLFGVDWGTPSTYDKDLTLTHYVNNYMDKSIDRIREFTGSDKVSIFGYCWGGNLALIYAAQHPEKVKSVITLATPGDFNLDNSLLSLWTKKLNPDSLVNTFGNVPSFILNAAFAIRSPLDYMHKYPHFFERPRDIKSIAEFFATEIWLYDSPPVIGEIYREYVRDFYQNNLMIKSKLLLDKGNEINLKNITAPYLNILATKDDLVAPDSSSALNEAVGSREKDLIKFNSGHVGACISAEAHKDLWPKVGDWIKKYS